jgi:hypothetical protein
MISGFPTQGELLRKHQEGGCKLGKDCVPVLSELPLPMEKPDLKRTRRSTRKVGFIERSSTDGDEGQIKKLKA